MIHLKCMDEAVKNNEDVKKWLHDYEEILNREITVVDFAQEYECKFLVDRPSPPDEETPKTTGNLL